MSDIIQNSRLLSLPGELRDRIFEFALTSDHGLEYESASSGVSNLCKRYCSAFYEEASIHIASHPLIKDPAVVVFHEKGTAEPFNKLKHTCKQLAAETTDLELKFNTLTVASGGYHGSYPDESQQYRTTEGELKYVEQTTALQRLHELGPSRMSMLRNVLVKMKTQRYYAYSTESAMLAIPSCLSRGDPDCIGDWVDFCIAHPDIDVCYFGPHIQYSEVMQDTAPLVEFINYGVLFAHAAHGLDLSALMPERFRSRIRKAMIDNPVTRTADNLRVQIFDQKLVDDSIDLNQKVTGSEHYTDKEFIIMMSCAQKWLEDGI